MTKSPTLDDSGRRGAVDHMITRPKSLEQTETRTCQLSISHDVKLAIHRLISGKKKKKKGSTKPRSRSSSSSSQRDMCTSNQGD
uniref:Uncharacterized protein n=1 Tax=Physcomitrium patens TaxID=3218 RepID=A0A2K1KKZ5_PHYPA|nr:hypothetical protein PHYPA_008128 [Physcomitrium patens]